MTSRKRIKNTASSAGVSVLAIILFANLFVSCEKDPVKGWTFYRDSPPPPKIDTAFGVVRNCVPPYPVSYYQQCSNLIGTINYSWDFGDGTTSHDQNPSHVYTNPGNYTVRLVISNEIGSDTAFIPMTELSQSSIPVTAAYSFTHFNNNNYAPNKIVFSNQSSGATLFNWYFGDGAESSENNPQHIFTNAGTYNVRMRATCSDGSYNEYNQQVFVNPAPQRVFIDSLNLMLPSGSSVYVEFYHNTTYVGKTIVKSGTFPIKFRRPTDFVDGYFFDYVQFAYNEVFKFVVLRSNGADPPTFLYEITLSPVDIQNRFYPRYYYDIKTVPPLQDVFIDLYISY